MAHAFTDSRGNGWTVELDADTMRRIHDDYGEPLTPRLLVRMFKGAGRFRSVESNNAAAAELVGLIWVIIETQASDRGVEPEQFGRVLGVDGLERAIKAIASAMVEKFPRATTGALRRLTRS